MTIADKEVFGVLDGGGSNDKNTPGGGNPTGSVDTGSPKKIDDSDDRIKRLEEHNKQLQEMLQTSQSEIGRLGEQIGEYRTQVNTNVNIEEIAKNVQSKILDHENPTGALEAMVSVVNELLRAHETTEAESVKSYRKVVNRNPLYKDIPYQVVREQVLGDGGALRDIVSSTGMEKIMNNILISSRANLDETSVRADERKKAEADMIAKLRASGFNLPSNMDGKPHEASPSSKPTSPVSDIAGMFGIPVKR